MIRDTRSSRRRSLFAGLGVAALSYGVAALGALTMRRRDAAGWLWFRGLRKDPGHPPDRVFGPVWTVLYGLIAYSGWRIWNAPRSPRRDRALALWVGQLALNGAWTPLFFGARRPAAALVDVVALDATAGAYVMTARGVDRTAALAFAPYLAWLGFATYLNGAIVALNPRPRLAP
jgi:tryptophan-rich sensory protein